MEARTVDLLAAGPPPADPYEPASSAWALAEGFRAHATTVRVLYPAGPDGAAPPAGVDSVAIEVPIRRPGAAVEPAEFARTAGRRIRADADLVLRDPSGLGPLGIVHRAGTPRLVVIVRGLELREYDRERSARAPSGFVDRVDTWRDRRTVRRLERAALEEADRIFCDAPALRRELADAYRIPDDRIAPTVPPVAVGGPPPPRDDARGALGLPTDVAVVATLASFEDPDAAGVDRAREAFRRIRPLFPGVRLVIAGATAPVEPGVHADPERSLGAYQRALAAADVALFPRRPAGFDPGLVLALRQGVAPVALPSARLPVAPDGAVRYTESDDPSDVSSAVAELVADLAQRKALAARGPRSAEPFRPDRVAADLLDAKIMVAP
jgi:glycosyltransferase involved in cell wall biosynthesis